MGTRVPQKNVTLERLREIAGLLLIFLGVFIFISLLQAPFRLSLLGQTGYFVASILILLLGGYVAFFIPVLFLLLAVALIRNTPIPGVWLRMLGLILAMLSLCLLLALVPANVFQTSDEGIFFAGGIVGNFFVQHDGLRLPFYLGYLGTVLLGTCLFIISLSLVLDLSVSTVAYHGKRLGSLAFQRVAVALRPRTNENKDTNHESPRFSINIKDMPKDKRKPLVMRHKIEIPKKAKDEATVAEQEIRPVSLKQADLFSSYKLPPLTLLDEPPQDHSVSMSDEELERLSDIIEQTLKDYGIEAQIGAVTQGPVVTRFELHPAPGIKINKILTLDKELSMVLRARSVRIQAPIPGKSAIGIEIPNPKVSVVYLKEMMQCQSLIDHKSLLAFVLGQTISGEPYICDLTSMPHLLIAGATGSGKSVCINSILCGILFRVPPDRVKFLLIDPKRVELSVYEEIPHLIAPVICEAREAAASLSWVVHIMEERYKQLVSVGVRHLNSYNRLALEGKPHPRIPGKIIEYMYPIVVIIDELADLMVVARQAVEENVIRLSQLARAVGIHLIIATQRPSVNVITGIIKANFPSRIAFQVSSKVDSRTILDMNGAEVLIGKGDMLFLAGGGHKPIRVQGTFVSDGEVERLVTFIKGQEKPTYMVEKFEVEKKKGDGAVIYTGSIGGGGVGSQQGVSEVSGDESSISDDSEEVITDELYHDALRTILMTGKASTSYLQRKLKIGYVRAGRLMDLLEEEGIVGPARGSRTREILVDPADYLGDSCLPDDEEED